MSDQGDYHSDCSPSVKSVISELGSMGIGVDDCLKNATDYDPETEPFCYNDGLVKFEFVSLNKYDPDWETKTYELPSSNVRERLSNILKLRTYPDFNIVLQDETIPCHKLTCSFFSPVLRENCTNNTIVIKQKFLTADLFNKMYDWLLGHPIRFKRNELFQLYRMAKYFKIDAVLELCYQCLDSAYFNEMASFQAIWELRKSPDLFDEIIKPFLHRVNKIHLLLFTTEEFRKLEENEIIAMLSSDDAGVNNESEIFYAATIWLEYGWPDRFNAVERVFACVRFGFMSPGLLQMFITVAMQPDEKPVVNEVSDEPDDPVRHFAHVLEALSQCQNLMTKIERSKLFLHYFITYGDDLPMMGRKCGVLKIPIYQPRNWIMDPFCKYHRKVAPKRPNVLSVKFYEFIDYLNELAELDPQEFIDRVHISNFSTQ